VGFPRGTWLWEAVAQKGAVLTRDNDLRVADLEDIGISLFRVKPRGPLAPMTVSRDGPCTGDACGLVITRNIVELYPMENVSGLRFTRRQSGALGGPATDEEILIRYTWIPSGRKVVVHIRPGQVLITEDTD